MRRNLPCMLALISFIALASAAIALPATAGAETPITAYIEHDITEDTTWPAGHYYICHVGNREPRVTNGATLTMESGARVYFSTRTAASLPGTGDKTPYSALTVTNGSLRADGVTFTTVPDSAGGTTWRDAGWNGIVARGVPAGATSLSFTDCTFEYGGSTPAGTVYGDQTNGVDSEVNIAVSGCTFRDPKGNEATAIGYNNGRNTVGTGTITVSDSTFTGYGRGVQVLDNQEDDVNTTVAGCTFSNMSIRPLEINGGRQASVTDCTFNNYVAGQHDGAVLIFDTDSATSRSQTVTLRGNTFNYGAAAAIYPVLIGAGTRINEKLPGAANNTVDPDYPGEYRYIQLTRGVGYLDRYRDALWGDAGLPYLLAGEITISGANEANQSSLTIMPGVTVCLGDGDGSDNLSVKGTLTAVGTADKPIIFTKRTALDYGNEIAAGNNLCGSITLKHCLMDGLYRGLGITAPGAAGSKILLENCTVRNSLHSMHLAGRDVLLKNCTLTGKGLSTKGGNYVNSIALEGCSITASGAASGDGIYLEPARSVVVKNCLIAGFSNCGIAVIDNGYRTLEEGAPLIENCTIAGNRYGVVFSRGYQLAYGAFIRNSIIAGNSELDLASKAYTSGSSSYPVGIAEGSIAYSLISDDGAALPFSQNYYDHPLLGKIRRIEAATYSNRAIGEPLFANAANGDYHLKSAAGRWNGSAWVTDAVSSPAIDAGDPASAYAREPAPNGGRINLGCYGNTAEASKSGTGAAPDTMPPSWSAGSTLTAVALTPTGATLSWSGASDDTAVTAYRIYQDGALVRTSSQTSCVLTGLSPDTGYRFKVEAGDAAGNWSTGGPATTVHTPATQTVGDSYVPGSAIVNHDDRVAVQLTEGSAVLSADQIEMLIAPNREKPVVLVGDGYTIIFPKGGLKPADGRRDYDFGIRFNTGTHYSAIRSIAGDSFVLMLDFNHSGNLPGEAQIRIYVGAGYAGEELAYYCYNPQGGKLDYVQSEKVDANGYIMIRQSRCSSYVFTLHDDDHESGALPVTGAAGSAFLWWMLPVLSGAGIAALALTRGKILRKR